MMIKVLPICMVEIEQLECYPGLSITKEFANDKLPLAVASDILNFLKS